VGGVERNDTIASVWSIETSDRLGMVFLVLGWVWCSWSWDDGEICIEAVRSQSLAGLSGYRRMDDGKEKRNGESDVLMVGLLSLLLMLPSSITITCLGLAFWGVTTRSSRVRGSPLRNYSTNGW
jgi:hypothetical protein